MSCMFNSISHLLNIIGIKDNSETVRYKICKYMENNQEKKLGPSLLKDWIKYSSNDHLNSTDIQKYIHHMKKNNSWGGGLELAISSKIYNIEFQINKQEIIVAHFNCCKKPEYLFKLNWSGNHYTPISAVKY